MSDWQPIETAPRDGSGVLLALDYGGRGYRYVAHWHRELGLWARDEVASAVFPSHMQNWFTHWMPLPAKPEESR